MLRRDFLKSLAGLAAALLPWRYDSPKAVLAAMDAEPDPRPITATEIQIRQLERELHYERLNELAFGDLPFDDAYLVNLYSAIEDAPPGSNATEIVRRFDVQWRYRTQGERL